MSLTRWYATELYPTPGEDDIGIAGIFEVVKLADVRAWAEAGIAVEPEFPDSMADEMYTQVRAIDKAGLEEFCRIIVRNTKAGIKQRLLAALKQETP